MPAQSRLFSILRAVRALGLTVAVLIAVAGAPQFVGASQCPYLITCSSADACVDVIGNNCGNCGTVGCAADWGCSGEHNVATICRDLNPE